MPKKTTPQKVDINIHGDVSQGNIIVGDGNVIGYTAAQFLARLSNKP